MLKMVKNNDKNLKRECPICCNETGEILYSQKFKLPPNYPLPSYYDIVSCDKCGFVYADTSATQDVYNNYYSQLSKYENKQISSGGGYNSWDSERLTETAFTISKFVTSKESSILDIGCANGGLLEKLKELGYSNLTGMDPSNTCVINVLNKGIDAFEGTIFNISTTQKFDCIILSHVLEHVYDLKLAIKNIDNVLNDGGTLYIETPDASKYHEYYITPFHYFDFEHINHFSKDSFKDLFNEYENIHFGEKEIRVSENNVYPSVYGIFIKNINRKISNNIDFSSKIKENVLKYIQISSENDKWPELDDIIETKEAVAIWGVGAYTLRLIENTKLNKCNIAYFIDSDEKKHNMKINNIPIYGPSILIHHESVIIVSSALYSNEIINQIRDMGLKNNIIVMK